MYQNSYFVEFTGSKRESEDNLNLVLSKNFGSLVDKIKNLGSRAERESPKKKNPFKESYRISFRGKKSILNITYLYSDYGSEIPIRVAVYNENISVLRKTLNLLNEKCENGLIRKVV